mgnify:CR=1 FL=1
MENVKEQYKDERPSMWSLAFPSILGNLSYTLVGLVQTKFVGELGAQGLAAVGAGQRIFFAMQAVMMAVSAGTTALVARAWGAGDYREASRVTMASLVLCSVFAIFVTIIGFFYAANVAAVFGLDAETLEMAADNIRWLCLFNVAFAVNFIMSAALRAAGDAWSPLWVGGAVNLVNLPLLYVFIFGEYGFPKMGVSGAAIAMGLSFTVGAIALIVLWVSQYFRVTYTSRGWWGRHRLKQLLHIGYPAAVEQAVFQLGFFIFLMLIGNYYGTEAFAAYNVGANLLMICITVGFGFSIAGSTLVGQHLGAADHEGAMVSGWRALRLAMISMGLLGLLVIYFAHDMAVFFVGGAPLTVEYTVHFTRILGAMMPLLAVEFAIGGALRGAGDTRFPLIATFLGLIGMRCGLAAIATYLEMHVFWVYASLIGDYLLKGSMLVVRFRRGRWKTVVANETLGLRS